MYLRKVGVIPLGAEESKKWGGIFLFAGLVLLRKIQVLTI